MDDIGSWLDSLFGADSIATSATEGAPTGGWSTFMQGISEGARGIMEGVAEGAKMISGFDAPAGTGGATPAGAARLETHPDELAGGASTGWSDSGPGGKTWLSKMLNEIDSKTKVAAVAGGLSGVGQYLAAGRTAKVGEEHYKRQDDIAAQRLALDQQKQLNAATSGANLKVGLIESPQYQDVAGGYAERRKRNLTRGA